jgi:hypothetical protein
MEGQIGERVENAYADIVILDKIPGSDLLDGTQLHLKAVIKGGYVSKSFLEAYPVDQLGVCY